MFGKKKKNSGSEKMGNIGQISAYLGPGTHFDGRFEFSGFAQIAGVFEGEVISDGTLVVAATGQVNGECRVGRVLCSGKIEGQIDAARTTLQRTGYFNGELNCKTLEIEEGARLEGTVNMTGKEHNPTDAPGKPD